MAKRLWVALLSTPAALIGCHSSSDGLSSDPPSSIEEVTSGGFQSPTDAVASPDGKTLYFAAWDLQRQPTLFSVSTEARGAAAPIAAGDPLEAPIGLVLSCDGKTLYVADLGGEAGAILAMSTDGGALAPLTATGLSRPGGLAMGPDCKSLFASGRLDDGTPAVFQIPVGGGDARVVYHGAPLVAPTGLHVDSQGVIWQMDHVAQDGAGQGVLFAIPSDGSKATIIASNLNMGTPGGVSLTAGGGVALVPTRDADGNAQLTSIDIATGKVEQLPAPMMVDPAGVRTARGAHVVALTDNGNDKIFLGR